MLGECIAALILVILIEVPGWHHIVTGQDCGAAAKVACFKYDFLFGNAQKIYQLLTVYSLVLALFGVALMLTIYAGFVRPVDKH